MTFSSAVKSELLKKSDQNACCGITEVAAVFLTAGSINLSQNGLYLTMSTENFELAEFVIERLSTLFNIEGTIISEKRTGLKGKALYTISTSTVGSEMLLRETSILYTDESGLNQIRKGIDKYMIEEDCCAVAFLKGGFLAVGGIYVPALESKNGGYHLEMIVQNQILAEQICQTFMRFNIFTRISERGGSFVVYAKEGETISDILVLIGARKAALRFNDIMVEREVKNNTNRQTNCIVANIDKSIDAAVKQIEAINLIEKKIGANGLPPKLREAARLRQEYPDFSLEQLADSSGGTITKSGINHRMRKIMGIAEELKDNKI